ncbi:MAG: heme exporter protein CcmD [Pseudomonadota bacterium]|nr:heme exporter protein CcmD [Pseudomonadota bacterium]
MSSGLADYLAMGGYGLYVWGSYGVTALVLTIELVMLRLRRQRAIRDARSGDEPELAIGPMSEVVR